MPARNAARKILAAFRNGWRRPELFDLGAEPLDEIAFAVEGEIARARGFSGRFGWGARDIRSSVGALMKASASYALSAIGASRSRLR